MQLHSNFPCRPPGMKKATTKNPAMKRAPSTARPLSRGPRALIGLPFSVRTGACYWHGVGGSMFNSSSSVPHRCRRRSAVFATDPQRIHTAGTRKQPGRRETKLGVFFVFLVFCAFGGCFCVFLGVFCQKTPRRTSAGVPHATRRSELCSALDPHLICTCAELVPHLCRTCAALVPHLCRTCAALVPHLCRNMGGSAARRPLFCGHGD